MGMWYMDQNIRILNPSKICVKSTPRYLVFLFILDALAYAESVGAVIVETSAKSAVNINVLFHELCKYQI